MEKELLEYFISEHEYYLDQIEYRRIEKVPSKETLTLNCEDNISTSIIEEGIKLKVTRTLKFDPEGLFYLSVAFGAQLTFNDAGKKINWSKIDVPAEFRSHGGGVISNLTSRISLMIGQITSSFGKQPIILPETIG